MAKAKKVAVQQSSNKQFLKKPSTNTQSVKASKQAKPTSRKQAVIKPSQTVNKRAVSNEPVCKDSADKNPQSVNKQSVHKTPAKLSKEVPIFDPLQYMTEEELIEVDRQFDLALADVDVVLFWTGVDFNQVQKFARMWRLKTLTMAMGPLMDPQNPNSHKVRKKPKSYSRYVKGASGRFAQYVSHHCRRVVVITNPPPNRYSIRDDNTYQSLEEPILKGLNGNKPIPRIDYIHPTVDGAAHITYQAWPQDSTPVWTTGYRDRMIRKWKGLNTSCRTLVGLSQLDLLSSRIHERASPSIHAPGPLLDHIQDSDGLPISSSSETIRTNRTTDGGCTAQDELRRKKLMDSRLTNSGVCIKGHESRFLDTKPRADSASSNRPEWQQSHNKNDREIDFHETGVIYKPSGSQTLRYTMKQCRVPSTLTAVSMINVDDVAVGTEITVNVAGKDSHGVFLYLTMSTNIGLKYWKLEWEE